MSLSIDGATVCYGWRVRKIATLLFASLVLTLPSARAHACSCMAEDVPTAFQRSDAVFEGRVIEVDRGDDPSAPVRVTMEVVQHWKGIEEERVIVQTAADSAMCGVAFEPETSWLVYATREGDALNASLCSRTARIEDAAEDLAELGAGVVPVEVGEDDEVEEQEPREAPARGGCASCSASSRELDPRALFVALGAIGALVARRARRQGACARTRRRSSAT